MITRLFSGCQKKFLLEDCTYLVSCWRQVSSPGVHLVISVASQFLTKYDAATIIIVNKKKLYPLSISMINIVLKLEFLPYNSKNKLIV